MPHPVEVTEKTPEIEDQEKPSESSNESQTTEVNDVSNDQDNTQTRLKSDEADSEAQAG